MNAKLCILLSWFDERWEWLNACVESLAPYADHLIAVDGAYSLFPNAERRSSHGQALAILDAAHRCDLPLTLHIPPAPWAGNEVEKRNTTVKLALSTIADRPEWWLMVVDADMRAVAGNPDRLRELLSTTPRDVAAFGMYESVSGPVGLVRRHVLPYPWIYRADPSLRYETAHYVVTSDRGTVNGPPKLNPLPVLDVSEHLVFVHRSKNRDFERRERALTYYRDRDRLRLEDLA